MSMSLEPRQSRRRQQEVVKNTPTKPKYIIIGGGIAGVCCAQECARLSPSDHEIIIITATEMLKETAGVMKITNHLDEFAVYERTAEHFRLNNPAIQVIQAAVLSVDTTAKRLHLDDGSLIHYDKLCVCSGARPKLITSHPHVIGLRDLQSVSYMADRLSSAAARRVVVLGNGGIALELVHALSFCEIDWVIRDNYVGSAFFDASASAFIMPELLFRAKTASAGPSSNVTMTTEEDVINNNNNNNNSSNAQNGDGSRATGAALGPEWLKKSEFLAQIPADVKNATGHLTMHFSQEIVAIREGVGGLWTNITDGLSHPPSAPVSSHVTESREAMSASEESLVVYPLYVKTSSGAVLGCDFVVSATGVVPCVEFLGIEFVRSTVAPDDSSHTLTMSSSSSSAAVAVDSAEATMTFSEPTASHVELVAPITGAVVVNECMRTSVTDVYAAGDCCFYCPSPDNDLGHSSGDSEPSGNPPSLSSSSPSQHWFQMRLWTQARSMGIYAAQCMCEQQDNLGGDFAFEIFAHLTRFFGYKVVLLGRYNAQGLGENLEDVVKAVVVTKDGLEVEKRVSRHQQPPCQFEPFHDVDGAPQGESKTTDMAISQETYNKEIPVSLQKEGRDVEIWTRVTPNEEYIKVVIWRGKVVGALLIGDTDLEEVFENLILSALDVSAMGVELLDPSVDLEAFFD